MLSVRHADSDCGEQEQCQKIAQLGGSVRKHLNRMAQNEREKPKRIIEMAVPARAVKRTGLRPM